MKSIAVINQKGGIGKTTTVGNLGAGLARRGHTVLMIDYDPQGALSIWFDVNHEPNLFDLISGRTEPDDCIRRIRENLSLLPGDRRLSEIHHKVELFWWKKMEDLRADGFGQYDYILMDCPPSWSYMSRFAVTVAEEVFMPVSMDYLSMIGIKQVIEGVGDVVNEEGVAPEIKIVIPTFFDRRQKKSKEILKTLQWHFGQRVSDPIRVNVSLSEAVSYHQSIFEYSPDSHGAEDYEKLVRRVENVQEAESCWERPSREDSGSVKESGEQEEIFRNRE
jgi:chromosome partitioning protein